MRVLSSIATAGVLVIGLAGAAAANTPKIDMDNGNGRVVQQTTRTSMHLRTVHRRHMALRHHRHHRHFAMHRHFRGYGYAPMYGYGYGYGGSPARSSVSSSYSGNVTETLGTSGSEGVNQ